MKTCKVLFFLLFLPFCHLYSQSFNSAISSGDLTTGDATSIAHDSEGNIYLVGNNSNATASPFFGIPNLPGGSFLIKFSPTGNVLWHKHIEGALNCRDVVVDESDNVYMLGTHHYTIEIDGISLPGSGYIIPQTTGNRMYLAKFSGDGDLQYAKKIESESPSGQGSVISYGIDTDDNNNLYLAGNFSNTIEVNGEIYPGEDNLFLIKLDSAGMTLWVETVEGNSSAEAYDISVFENSIYFTGELSGSNFDFGDINYSNTESGKRGYVAKYNTDGIAQWVIPYNGNGASSVSFKIESDDKGQVYILSYDLSYSPEAFRHTISKIHPLGSLLFTNELDVEHEEYYSYGPGFTVHYGGHKFGNITTHENNLYFTAGFIGNFSFDSYTYNDPDYKSVAIVKLNEIGILQWVKTIDGTYYDTGTAITFADSNMVLTGSYSSSELNFDGNIISHNSGNNGADIFITKGEDTTSLTPCPVASFSLTAADISFCDEDSLALFTGGDYGYTFEWYQDSVALQNGPNDTFYVKQPGKYWALINPSTVCEYISDTIEIELAANYVSGQTDIALFPLPVFTLGNDTTVCQELAISPDTLLNNVYYEWSTLETTSEIVVDTSGTYWVEGTYNFGCSIIDTIEVTIIPNPIVDFGSDILIDSYDVIGLEAGSIDSAYTYLWNDGSTQNNISINPNSMDLGIDTFSVEVTNFFGCVGTDTISICLCSSIHGIIFYDFNNNKIQDVGESVFPDASLTLESGSFSTFNNPFNGINFFVEPGSYQVQYNDITDWELTTDSMVFHSNITQTEPYDTLRFGIQPTQNLSNTFSTISAPPTRCNEPVVMISLAKNTGTTLASGTLWLEIDNAITSYTFIDTPTQQIGLNKFGWDFQDLYPGYSFEKTIEILSPGPTDFPIGDSLYFYSYVEYSDANGTQVSNTFEYPSEFRCAYDPNDKLVFPNRENNFTLFEEDLIYTIRFQNTGNDYAKNVVIRDTLSTYIEESSFVFLNSSHDDKLTITQYNNELTFYFNDIFLPDSTENFQGSQGFVSFLVKSKEGLDDEIIINNSASIYFDFNPPILTNETENLMFLEFPVDVDNDGYYSFEDCNDENADINPDAIEIANNDVDENCDDIILVIDVDGDGFNSDEDCNDENADINPDAMEIANNDIDENCDDIVLIIDVDGDGFNSDVDCDDENADINPDAMEIANNDIDENCDDIVLVIDMDGDGFNSDEDCDDENPNINPDAMEIANNGIDEDCDEEDLVTSINSITGKSNMVIYPNPFSEEIVMMSFQNFESKISVKNILGKTVLIVNQKIRDGNNRLEMKDLTPGVYFLIIENTDNQIIQIEKLIKE